MPIKFMPRYTITPTIAQGLMCIEAAKERVISYAVTPTILASLRESARLYTTHYSTMIEGNRLAPEQIEAVLKHAGHFPGRERDEREVKGYYAALEKMEKAARAGTKLTEKMIQELHGLVMAGGKATVKPTRYRTGQNVIRDGRTGDIIYMPPEANDVSELMQEMVAWINHSQELPCPIVAGIAHYQFATIHPYYDGNGRTVRLLTTFILYAGGYDLKGLYSLEEYYARNLGAYYEAISIGDFHNYYMGRAEADITKWIEYFIQGMAVAFENVLRRMTVIDNKAVFDQSGRLRELDPRQRMVLVLFQESLVITSHQVSDLFGFKPRTGSQLCKDWVENGFLEVVDSSNKGRKYKLASRYAGLIK